VTSAAFGHRVISLLRSNRVGLGAKRTSTSMRYPSIAVLPTNHGDLRKGREAVINTPYGRKRMFNAETALQS
jgi:hypothetical protein